MELRKVSIKGFKELTGVHITEKHTGKMEGMQSLSTSCACNPYCKKYANDPKKVCSHCYASRQLKMYSKLDNCLEENTSVLSKKELDFMPAINSSIFRFESFGDIQNELQVKNYFDICKYNPFTSFSIWTKNPGIMGRAIAKYGKPENLNIILSSPYLNKTIDINKYSWADKVFTVYDKKTVKEQNIVINCGSRKCVECQQCYRKNNVQYVNELLK